MSSDLIFHPEQNFDKLKSKGVSLAAFLDTIRPRKDKTYSVRIRIIHDRTPRYLTTKINITEDDYKKILGPKVRGDLKDKKQIIYQVLKKANDIICDMPEFSFDRFKILFLDKYGSKESVTAAFEREIENMKKSGRIGTASSYECAKVSLKEFNSKEKLTFRDITPKFLSNYEAWMLKKERSPSTIGIYLRPLRKIFNDAIRAGIIKQDSYPFGKDKYEIPTSRNIKKALTITEIGKLYKFKVIPNSPEHFYRDLWFFSYFASGLNVKDICLLKYKDIKGESIYLSRAKTQKTNRNPIPISILVTPELQQIIDTWGNKKRDPENYIFQILRKSDSPETLHRKVKQTVKQINKYINSIAQAVELNQKVTTYTARHSYATVLKRSGVNTEYISESLGHADMKTTQNYLDSFETDTKKEISKKLLDFGDEI